MSYIVKYEAVARPILLERKNSTHQTLINPSLIGSLSRVIYRLSRKQKWRIITDLDRLFIAHYRLLAGWYTPDKQPESGPRVQIKGFSYEN